ELATSSLGDACLRLHQLEVGRLCRGDGRIGALESLRERGTGGARTRSADTPTREPEPIAVACDDEHVGMSEGEIDGRGPVTVDDDHRSEQRIEQPVDVAAV